MESGQSQAPRGSGPDRPSKCYTTRQDSFGGDHERTTRFLAGISCFLCDYDLSLLPSFGILFAGGSAAFAVVQPSHASDETPADTARFSRPSDYQDVEADVSGPSQLRQVDEGVASDKTFAGLITDSHCGARHSMKSGKSSAECARSCVRNGAHYVLVDGEKNHSLDGGTTRLEELAGERVEVVGSSKATPSR